MGTSVRIQELIRNIDVISHVTLKTWIEGYAPYIAQVLLCISHRYVQNCKFLPSVYYHRNTSLFRLRKKNIQSEISVSVSLETKLSTFRGLRNAESTNIWEIHYNILSVNRQVMSFPYDLLHLFPTCSEICCTFWSFFFQVFTYLTRAVFWPCPIIGTG